MDNNDYPYWQADEKLESNFNKAVEYIHNKGGFKAEMLKDKPVKTLLGSIYGTLEKAVDFGLSETSLPEEIYNKLKDSTFIFSGCKTYEELKEVSGLLLDDNGNIKSMYNFVQDVKSIHANYNVNYLEAEYLFAQDSATMAGKWHEFTEDGDRYNLQYNTAGDDRVRIEHEQLNRTTLPVNNVFWTLYYPPNGWRCRCNVVQVRKNKYPVSDSVQANNIGDKATLDKNSIFRFNSGLQATIFPKEHPYFRNLDTVEDILKDKQ